MQSVAEPMQKKIETLSKGLRDKDSVIEQLQTLLRRKETEETDL